MAGKCGQTSIANDRQLRSKTNKVKTARGKNNRQQSPEEPDTAHNRKRTAAIPKPNKKRPQVLAADTQWCVCNVSTLTLKAFALEYDHYERRSCHARYRTIITHNLPEAEQSRLLQELENWCLTLDCTDT